MKSLERIVAVMPSYNVLKGKDFYVEKLKFNLIATYGEPNIDLAILKRDNAEIHLFQCNEKGIPEWTSCRIQVTNIEELYQEYKASGVIHPNGILQVKPWGLKEFVILDDSGTCINFFSTI